MGRTCSLFIILGVIFFWLAAAEALDVFYVSVGNSHYRHSSMGDVRSFEPISGGNKSARKVAEYLDRIGASGGVLFRSEPDRFVTRQQVIEALQEVIAKAKTYPNPLIFYYFIGHGVSEGIGWNHFSVPGDFLGIPQGCYC